MVQDLIGQETIRTSLMAYASQLLDNSEVLIAEVGGEEIRSKGISDILSFLLEDLELEETQKLNWVRVCWDLDEFTAPIFRLLGKEACRSLVKTNRVELTGQDKWFKIYYQRHKVFGITGRVRARGNMFWEGEANYYGIKQFFPDNYRAQTVDEVQELGKKMLYAFECLGLYPKKLTSAINVFQEDVMAHMSIPTAYDVSKDKIEALQYAQKCTNKEWRECLKVGAWV